MQKHLKEAAVFGILLVFSTFLGFCVLFWGGAFIFALLIVTIYVGIWFSRIVSRQSGIPIIIAGIIYFVIEPTFIGKILNGYEEAPDVVAMIALVPSALLSMGIQWVVLNRLHAPRWVGTTCLMLVFFSIPLCVDPTRSVVIEKLKLGPTLSDADDVLDVRNDKEAVKLTVPRPYFSDLEDRHSAHPEGVFGFWLDLCYPQMTAWNAECESKNGWKLRLQLRLHTPNAPVDSSNPNGDLSELRTGKYIYSNYLFLKISRQVFAPSPRQRKT